MLQKIINKNNILKLYIAFIFASLNILPFYRDISSLSLFGLWIASFIVWFILASCVMAFGGKLVEYVKDRFKKLDSVLDKHLSGIKIFFVIWGILVLAWILPYLSLFPGTFGYDAPLQLLQWQGTMEMTDHHPVTHTFLLGVIYNFGVKVFGTANAGIALFTGIQGLLVTSAISYSLYILRKQGASAIYILLSLIWVVFNPFLQALTFNCTKDIMFGAFFVYFIMTFYNYVKSDTKNIATIIIVVLSGILMCLLRHQGVYILFVLLIFVVFAPKRINIKKLKTAIIIICIFVVAEGFSIICHNVLNYESGDSREMLSVPIQQMAYVCKQKIEGQPIDVTEEQLEQVESFIPEAGIMSYKENTADDVKSTFDTNSFKDNIADNLKTYLQLGWQNKGSYIYAFKNLINGYINDDKRSYAGLMYLYTFKSEYDMDIHRDSIVPSYYDSLVANTVDLRYRNIPLMSVIYNSCISIWLLVILIGLSVYRRDYKLWLVVIPLLLYLMTLFLGPVALVRYMYPLILLTPLLIYLIVGGEKS